MTALILEANKRDLIGKAARKRRLVGMLPAVLYGREVSSLSLEVPHREFLRVLKEAGENTILKLEIISKEGRDIRNVLIHDVSIDALSGEPLHVDFYQVRLDETVEIMVPLKFIGESSAVKNDGGVLVKSLQEIELEALPGSIPEAIEVDISLLRNFEDAIHVRDLKIPTDVTIITELDVTVATVQPPRKEEELKALDSSVTAAVPQVMTEIEAKKKAAESAAASEEEISQQRK